MYIYIYICIHIYTYSCYIYICVLPMHAKQLLQAILCRQLRSKGPQREALKFDTSEINPVLIIKYICICIGMCKCVCICMYICICIYIHKFSDGRTAI